MWFEIFEISDSLYQLKIFRQFKNDFFSIPIEAFKQDILTGNRKWEAIQQMCQPGLQISLTAPINIVRKTGKNNIEAL